MVRSHPTTEDGGLSRSRHRKRYKKAAFKYADGCGYKEDERWLERLS